MDYRYYLGNASLTLRVVGHLQANRRLRVDFMTVMHQINGWVVRVKLMTNPSPEQDGNFRAFMSELGIPYEPEMQIKAALWELETGQLPVNVMHRYQVAIVSHGRPDRTEIEEFQKQFIQGLGYCPQTLA